MAIVRQEMNLLGEARGPCTRPRVPPAPTHCRRTWVCMHARRGLRQAAAHCACHWHTFMAGRDGRLWRPRTACSDLPVTNGMNEQVGTGVRK